MSQQIFSCLFVFPCFHVSSPSHLKTLRAKQSGQAVSPSVWLAVVSTAWRCEMNQALTGGSTKQAHEGAS